MANPRGNLAGATDPSVPGWQDRLLGKVRENQRKDPTNRGKRPTQINVRGDVGFFRYVRMAAQERDISISAYCRRAIAAFVAKDLGIEFTEVVRHTAKPTHYDQPPTFGPRTADDGEGWGDWRVE